MGTLDIGRVASISDPTRWEISANRRRGARSTVSGFLTDSVIADRDAKATELEYQVGQVVAVVYLAQSVIDGYYTLTQVRVDRSARFAPASTTGGYRFSAQLEWIGDHSSTEFLSNFTGLLIVNDHGLAEGEVIFAHAPPVAGDDAYFAGGATTATTRTTEDGVIPVFLDVPLTDKIGAARWGCAPANFYKGSARVDVNGYTRGGRFAPMTPDSFVIGNGLIELRAEQSGGTTIGDIGIRAYNGGWGSWTAFDIVWDSTDDIPEWHLVSIIRNDPSAVILQLVRDADEAPPTDSRHWLTFTLRRGMPFVRCHYTYSNSVALTVDRASIDAGTSVTPTGASSAMAIRDAANDGDGNRWMIAAADVSAVDTTNGGLDMATAASHSFMLGFEIAGSSADGDNDADALSLQYLADLTESVQAMLR